MIDEIGLALAETLAARLCHELISPVGAIANGAEILEDEPDFAEDATRLIADSTRSVVRRLQFYREAYGSRGGESRARQVTLEFFKEGKIVCDWPEDVAPVTSGLGKLACNLLLLASETLPRGGRIALSNGNPSGVLCATASGEGAHIDSVTEMLQLPVATTEELTPRSVQAIFTKFLADRLNFGIEPEQSAPNNTKLLVRPVS